jgi:tRNA pseudouridine32 synthase/23S rRNA pseudouridine746 synthase
MQPDVIQDGAPIRFVHVDDSVLVLDKPAGLLSVPGRGPDKQDCLSARVQAQYPDALVVHRLDMSTSGLIVMARSAVMQRALSSAFEHRLVRKRYVAVVSGDLDAADGEWQVINLPIGVDWPNRPCRVIDPQNGQPSTTRFRVIHTDPLNNTTRVELEPVTGRTHQLRVHLLAIGHPILGDMLYGPAETAARSPRLLLHACALAFAHPHDGEPLQLASPADF